MMHITRENITIYFYWNITIIKSSAMYDGVLIKLSI